jgi:hypothetical protein
MKLKRISILAFFMLFAFSITFLNAQEEEKTSPFSVGADVYTSYVWRGTKFGGTAIQPTVKYVNGGLTVGVWGSYGLKTDASTGMLGLYAETDPYISYSFPFGLSLGVTDYYYEGDFSELSDSLGSQAFEVNLGYTIGSLSFAGNYILNEAGGAASAGGDMYFQLSYAFSYFTLFAGAGNGWHTLDNEDGEDVFNICNVGLSTTKTIKVTDSFSIPVTGQLIVNPDSKQFFAVAGFSF